VDELFDYWDSDCSGKIDLNFVDCAFARYEPVPLTDVVAEGTGQAERLAVRFQS